VYKSKMTSPIEKHQPDYKENTWKNYSLFELGMWVHLFMKRSTHRKNEEKRKKDVYDAKNYLWMMGQKIKEIENEI